MTHLGCDTPRDMTRMLSQALALQALRVFRIVKLTKHLTGLKALTARAFGSPAGVGYALVI